MPSAEPKLRLLVRHSAAPKDVALAEELLRHLRHLERFAGLDVWSEARIRAGDETRKEIQRAIDQADVTLLLLSADFFASDGLVEWEVPLLVERHRQGRLRVIPVLLRSCLWDLHPWLKDLHPLSRDGKAIGAFSGDERDAVLTELAREIAGLTLTAEGATPSAQSAADMPLPRDKGGATFHINIQNSTLGSAAFGDGVASNGKVDVGRMVEKNPAVLSGSDGAGPQSIARKRPFLQFVSISIDQADTNWSQVPQAMMYVDVDYTFRKSLFDLADPTFDVTVLNTRSKPLVLTRVGIKIASIALRTRVAGIQYPAEIPKTHSYVVEIDDTVERILGERIPDKRNRSWSYGPEDINHCFWVTLPNPIRVPSQEPYRYGLLLKGFEAHLPNFCSVAMLAMTDRGESTSPLIEMRSW